MIARIIEAWRGLRSRFWPALALDVAVICALFLGIHAWQTRDLPLDEPAPVTELSRLDGSGSQSAIAPGQAGIVYFFAPWCRVCRVSIDNLDDLVARESVAWGTLIALDYEDREAVQEFVDATGVSLPVLLGDSRTARDWGIRGFPTYYVIDAGGRITSRSLGYSTWLGMWGRNVLARW
jgi:thiol-disulfide isomerase/thioredoxin